MTIISNGANRISNGANRNPCIDIAKGIGIILVVFAHMNYSQPYQNIIYGFHMPLFFVISGILFFPEKYGGFLKFLKQKIKTLICPYILFVAITIVVEMFLVLPSDATLGSTLVFTIKQAYCYAYSRGSMFMMNYPMWFVLCLFLTEIIFYFVTKLKGAAFWAVAVILTAFGWYVESDYCGFAEIVSRLPWSVNSACFAIGFMAVGYKLRPTLSAAVKKYSDARWKTLLISMILMVVMIPLALLNGKVSIGSKILNNGVLLYITGCLGAVSVLALSNGIKQSEFLQFCGKNSFSIMAVHVLLKDVLFAKGGKLSEMLSYDNGSILNSLLPFLIVFAAALIFAAIYARIKKRITSIKAKC